MSDVPCLWCGGKLEKIMGGKNMPGKFRCKDLECTYEIEIPPDLDLTKEPQSDKSVNESAVLAIDQSDEDLINDPQVSGMKP